MSITGIPSSAVAVGADTGWAEFTSFVYEGHDPVFDTQAPSSAEFYNPILAGSYPDPSICRVGGDFYLINSSFAFYPGIPIFHSTDLTHWTQIGHVLDRPSQLDLDGLSVSHGIYAPDISYHDGRFYVITTNIYGIGNFYVTATNPAGPWSDPVLLKRVKGIDPAFFWDDDGRAYIVHNGEPPDNKPLYDGHRAVWLWEFDLKTGDVIGEGKIVVNGGTDLAKKPSWIEGPHLLRRDGFYYLSAAEGGTGPKHSQVVFRSRSVWGPYEPFADNPILTQRDLDPKRKSPITAVGHADLVETASGDWWAVFLGMRGGNTLGRETFLLPVTWKNGWPSILEHGIPVPRIVSRPKLPAATATSLSTSGTFVARDEFDKPALGLAWNFLRTPREPWWSLTARPGSLRMEPRPVPLYSSGNKDVAANRNPSLLLRRVQHSDFSATTTLNIRSATADSDAGIAVLQHNDNYFFLGVRTLGGQARQVFVERCAKNASVPEIVATSPLPEGVSSLDLRLAAKENRYTFAYRAAGRDWKTVMEKADGSMLDQGGSNFVGASVGLYARTVHPDVVTDPIVRAAL
jgi:xylan 1,4-beta-xylosidase